MAAAARNHHQVLKQTFRLFTPRGVEGLSTRPSEELDESDVWNCQPDSRKKPAVRPHGAGKKPEANHAPVSVPVNVPDWQKILLHEYKSSYISSSHKEMNVDDEDEDEDEDEEEEVVARRLPPHEIVMRRRTQSMSVVEGAGRTLKGRDLSRVRNAIWARTGFQD